MPGRLTRSNMREELELIFGSQAIGNTRVDRWVNLALDEITGSIDFVAQLETASFNTVYGKVGYAEACDCLGVTDVWYSTNDNKLLYSPPRNFIRFDETVKGPPKRYTRMAGKIHLWPTPGAVYAVKYLNRQANPGWSVAGNTSGIPSTWDPVLLALAAHYGFSALEELDRAAYWHQKAMTLIRSRLTDDERDSEGDAEPISVINCWEQLHEQLDYDPTQGL